MSRIILQKYDNGDVQYVVGWDRPLQTFFWHEYSREHDENGHQIWGYDTTWKEMVAKAGQMPGEIASIIDLKLSAPEPVERLLTERVVGMLEHHRRFHDDPGRVLIDMTKTPPTVEQ